MLSVSPISIILWALANAGIQECRNVTQAFWGNRIFCTLKEKERAESGRAQKINAAVNVSANINIHILR